MPEPLRKRYGFDGIIDVREFDLDKELNLTTSETEVGIVGREGTFLFRATDVPIRYAQTGIYSECGTLSRILPLDCHCKKPSTRTNATRCC